MSWAPVIRLRGGIPGRGGCLLLGASASSHEPESLLVADSRVGRAVEVLPAQPGVLWSGARLSKVQRWCPGFRGLRARTLHATGRGGSLSRQIGGGAGLTRGGDGSRLRWRHGAGCGWLR